MFAALGLGAYSAGIFHLFTHAFFKALLFLGAGSVIHAMHHEQDMRHMGGLRSKIPITWAMMLIGTLSLTGVGIPHLVGFAGFHSKDTIIEAAFAGHTAYNYAFWVLVFAAFMTSFYSWRLMFMTFHGRTRADHHTYEHAHESPYVMLVPLFVLATGAVVAGFVFNGMFVGDGYKMFWGKAIFEAPNNHIMHDLHEIPGWVGWMPFVAMAGGFALSYTYYVIAPWLPEATARTFRPLYLFLLNKWYFDELYDFLFVRPARALGNFLWRKGDGAVIDGAIDGTATRILTTANSVGRLQTGFIYHYAFAMLIGLAALITWFMLGTGGIR
jgi:NADH-quinone oxidoreductase subunit L